VAIDPARDDAYWSLMCDVWAEGRSTLIVEHDVEIHSGVIPSLLVCREPWCVYPYNGPGVGQGGDPLLYRSLGCTRFSSAVMRDLPALVRDSARPDAVGVAMNSWRRLDIWIGDRMRDAGIEVHTHWPPVDHHHVYDGGCACGRFH
jgi:hypothetical protein